MEFFENSKWASAVHPKISVITPFYNRIEYLPRPFGSLKSQTFTDFEYIIVNDGSSENADDMVHSFMNEVSFPVLYIKKSNGGVHTARNQGVRLSRGELIAFLDADDEFMPDAFKTMIEAWNGLADKSGYREVVAREIDENGNPINSFIALNRADIFKQNLFPEPEGVKFVNEEIMWRQLSSFKSFLLDVFLYIYHRGDVSESITQPRGKVSIQRCTDNLWNYKYMFDNRRQLGYTLKESLLNLFYFLSFRSALKLKKAYPEYEWAEVNGTGMKAIDILCKPLALVSALYYISKRM